MKNRFLFHNKGINMKILKWIVLTGVINLSAFGSTIDGIVPELNYDEEVKQPSVRFGSQYLFFVPESIRFPSATRLSQAQKKKFDKALEIMEEVMNSESFRQKVISYKRVIGYDDKKPIWERSFQKSYLWRDASKHLTNEEVYNVILNGDELMRANTIGEMNFNSYVKICNWWQKVGVWCRNVIGSTSPYKSKMITLNWKFYQRFEVHEMVSNMVHEWIHLLGFLHGKENMKQEVPYVVGAIAGQVAKDLLSMKK